ncbi:hypothetical protein PR048_029887 [Dryococelus australis]|uniref:DDE-1 domain-containing protein n=1 Tax=Dryococelus australis TaxID=614101 RepID=A0ABQ9G7E6_9NEOP|nr:hypothetical protein PR048_029887 [Dryococelus australis]
MPRHRPRTTQKASWNAGTLAAAVKSTQEDETKVSKLAGRDWLEGIGWKGLAGRYWLEGFMKRHPRISLRQPQASSINRITAFNKDEVRHLYDNLEGLMVKYKFSPDKIFNVDETRISTVQNSGKIVAKKGAFCKPDPKNHVLLVLDNLSSHFSLESYDFCHQNGIIMLSLPPRTSRRMQPLDVAFYAPLKKVIMKHAEDGCVQAVDITEQGMENVTSATSPVMPSYTTINRSVSPNMDLIPSICTGPSCSLQDVTPVPKINSPNTTVSKTRCGRKMHSQVLTSTPQKKCLEDAKQKKADTKKKERRTRKPEKIHNMKNFSGSSSEDDSAVDLCGDDNEPTISNTEDICILCGDEGQDNELWYRVQVHFVFRVGSCRVHWF